MADRDSEYKKLRSFLNKAIRGKNTDAVLRSIASGPAHLVNNVEAVNDSLYIVSAQGRYLDSRLGDKGVVRPPNVGLSDEVFREIGIEITNRKQVRDLVHQLLRILYGEYYTRATSFALEAEPYDLSDGDNLILSFDGSEEIEITLSANQFQNIGAATAREVADAITKSIRKLGSKGAAFVQQDGNDFKVALISSTDGPSSSVRVLGGRAQVALKFDEIRNTSAAASTQWTLTQEDGGVIRATWTGGADPALGRVKPGDYVIISGSAFDLANQGTFDIVTAQGGTIGNSYVEYENPRGIPETITQGNDEAVLFFNDTTKKLIDKQRFAAAYQTNPRTLEVFLPATTKIVRRDRAGAAHAYDDGPSNAGQLGPYTTDTEQGFTLGDEVATTTQSLDIDSDQILFVDDSNDFPDAQGSLIIGYGTSHQEGPVPYISRPSSSSLRVNPAYRFKKKHPVGTEISLIATNSPAIPQADGSDFPFYATDSVAGRIYAEDIIREITATGIIVVIFVLYPSDIGLGKAGDPENSEKFYIWGETEDLIGE